LRSFDRNTLLIFFGLALLGVVTSALLLATLRGTITNPWAEFQLWAPRIAELREQEAHDRLAIEDFDISPADQALLLALAAFHTVEVTAGPSPQNEAHAEASEKLQALVESYVIEHGPERYARVGLLARTRFLEALAEASEIAAERDITLVTLAENHPDEEVVRRIRNLSGDFIHWGTRAGLVDNIGSTGDVQLFIAATLYKVRWLQRAEGVVPLEGHLSPLERRALLAYRVELQPGLDLDNRLRLLRDLKEMDPAYPAHVMEIVILAKAGKTGDARERLAKALEARPRDPVLRRLGRLVGRADRDREGREGAADREAPPGSGAGAEPGARPDTGATSPRDPDAGKAAPEGDLPQRDGNSTGIGDGGRGNGSD
jgi:hypothetical protein